MRTRNRIPYLMQVKLRRLHKRKLAEALARDDLPFTRPQIERLVGMGVYGDDLRMVFPDGISRPMGGLTEEAEAIWFEGLGTPETRITGPTFPDARRQLEAFGGEEPTERMPPRHLRVILTTLRIIDLVETGRSDDARELLEAHQPLETFFAEQQRTLEAFIASPGDAERAEVESLLATEGLMRPESPEE